MPEKDVNSAWFIKNKVILAEIINYLIFDKKIVITPDMLQEENPEIKLDTPLIQEALGRSIERRRDLYSSVRIKEDPGTNLFFVGVENQSSVDNLMAERALVLDVLGVQKQRDEERVRLAQKRKAKFGKENWSETEEKELNAFKPKPVITFVINLSGHRWTGPMEFADTLEFKIIPKDKYPVHYRMYLIDPWAMSEEDINFFKSEFGTLLRILTHGNPEEQFNYAVKELDIFEEIKDPHMFEFLKGYFKGFDFPKYLETGGAEMNEGAQIFEKFIEDKGREKARKEYENRIAELENKTIESAIKMLKKGYPIEDIVDITGLSVDKINSLKASLTAVA